MFEEGDEETAGADSPSPFSPRFPSGSAAAAPAGAAPPEAGFADAAASGAATQQQAAMISTRWNDFSDAGESLAGAAGKLLMLPFRRGPRRARTGSATSDTGDGSVAPSPAGTPRRSSTGGAGSEGGGSSRRRVSFILPGLKSSSVAPSAPEYEDDYSPEPLLSSPTASAAGSGLAAGGSSARSGRPASPSGAAWPPRTRTDSGGGGGVLAKRDSESSVLSAGAVDLASLLDNTPAKQPGGPPPGQQGPSSAAGVAPHDPALLRLFGSSMPTPSSSHGVVEGVDSERLRTEISEIRAQSSERVDATGRVVVGAPYRGAGAIGSGPRNKPPRALAEATAAELEGDEETGGGASKSPQPPGSGWNFSGALSRSRPARAFRGILKRRFRNLLASSREEREQALLDGLGRSYLVFKVQDSGVGMAQPRRLFEPSRNEQGRRGGLGFTVARGLAEAMQGGVFAESNGPAFGVTLTFFVPFDAAPDEPPPVPRRRVPAAPPPPPTTSAATGKGPRTTPCVAAPPLAPAPSVPPPRAASRDSVADSAGSGAGLAPAQGSASLPLGKPPVHAAGGPAVQGIPPGWDPPFSPCHRSSGSSDLPSQGSAGGASGAGGSSFGDSIHSGAGGAATPPPPSTAAGQQAPRPPPPAAAPPPVASPPAAPPPPLPLLLSFSDSFGSLAVRKALGESGLFSRVELVGDGRAALESWLREHGWGGNASRSGPPWGLVILDARTPEAGGAQAPPGLPGTGWLNCCRAAAEDAWGALP